MARLSPAMKRKDIDKAIRTVADWQVEQSHGSTRTGPTLLYS
jgi:hypothetical protein